MNKVSIFDERQNTYLYIKCYVLQRGQNMGLGFSWFKEYEIKSYGESFNIEQEEYFKYDEYYIWFLDGDSTSHSYYNVSIIQELFYDVCGKNIPRLPYEPEIDSKEYKLELIAPNEMVVMCDKVLLSSMVDKVNMRNRVEWFKKLSEDGYYIAYNYE